MERVPELIAIIPEPFNGHLQAFRPLPLKPMVNPNINKYNQVAKEAYLPTQPGITPAQQERLETARGAYDATRQLNQEQLSQLPNDQYYQRQLARVERKYGQDVAASRSADLNLSQYMLKQGRDLNSHPETLQKHSAYAAKLSPEQQQRYGQEVTAEAHARIKEQDQNQRPERSHTSHEAKASHGEYLQLKATQQHMERDR